MKLLQGLLFIILMEVSLTSNALDQSVQFDLLEQKAAAAMKADRPADAIPYFRQLEDMASKGHPLSEDDQYHFIVALQKSGNNNKEALNRATSYLNKYGKRGAFYNNVVEIAGPLQEYADREERADAERKRIEAQRQAIEAERLAKEASEKRDREAREKVEAISKCKEQVDSYKKALVKYNYDFEHYDENVRKAETYKQQLTSECTQCYKNCEKHNGFFDDTNKYLRCRSGCSDDYACKCEVNSFDGCKRTSVDYPSKPKEPACASSLQIETSSLNQLPSGYVSQGGLTWMPVDSSKKSWSDANSYCNNSSINGQTGWRLPTKDELKALYDSGAMKNHGWTLYNTWSSTPIGSGAHYNVSLNGGGVDWLNDMLGNYVTCIH